MSPNPLEGLKAAENLSELAIGHTNDDASARLISPDTQSSSNNDHTWDNFSPKATDAGHTNDVEASTRPLVPDATKNAPPTSTVPSGPTEILQLLQKLHQTLKDSTIAQESGTDDKSRFWATYKRHAEEYDTEFFEKYRDDMDIVLIFAGLFSAVSTSFLTAMQSSLSADPTDTTNALLMQVVHALNNTAFAGQNIEPPVWNGPGSVMIWVQSFIYASLSASLLAALGAVLGKQWLGQYRQKGLGMNDERGRRRQKKLDGAQAWHLRVVLEALPVLLQISLLLFSVALSAYVWTQQSTVGAVVISVTALGMLLYLSITATSMISPNCPFQTPLSIVLMVLWRRAHRVGRTALTTTADGMLRTQLGREIFIACLHAQQEPHHLGISKIYHRVSSWIDDLWCKMSPGRARFSADLESLSGSVSLSPPSGPLKLDIPPHCSVQDAPSVKWLLETSTDPDVITAAARIVPEVEWPAELDLSAAGAQLGNIFEGCFVYKNDLKTWQLAPFCRERALACGKALVYLDCEKSYISTKPRGADSHIFPFHRCTGSQLLEMFAVLWSENKECKCLSQVFLIQRHIMDGPPSLPEGLGMSLGGLQGGWSFHSLPYLLSSPQCPDHIKSEAAKEITRQLSPTNLPSLRILADCLLSAAILVGVPIDQEVPVKVNKSSAMESLLGMLLQHRPLAHGVDWCEHPVRYLFQPLALLWEDKKIRPKLGPCKYRQCCCEAVGWSLQMCILLVEKAKALGPSTGEKDQQALWKDARAALHFSAVASARDHIRGCWHPTYGGHCGRPAIADLAWTLDFLDCHYRARDEIAVADTFFMLSQARDIALWAKSPKFIEAIIFAMQPDKSTQVRDAALHTAWEVRQALATPDDAIIPLLPAFSVALLSAVSSGDRSTVGERDVQYLHIMFTCARSEVGTWDALFRSEGHLQKCLDMAAQHATWSMASVYLITVAETFESRGAEGRFLDPALGASHLISAWHIVDRELQRDVLQLEEVEETLPSLIAYTRRFPETDPGSEGCMPHVQSVLGKLRQRRPDSLRIGEMEDLVEWSEARENRGSEGR